MIELGRRQKLQVVKKVEFGVYLGEKADAKEQERVLLPAKQVPADTKVGDELEVFIYRDSADRLIATTRIPALELHQTAVVKVAEVGKIGASADPTVTAAAKDSAVFYYFYIILSRFFVLKG